ncbi:MAG: Gfo/Idh/MocA family oxidoreductase, partial [Verrucomicrobiota bacterium]
MKFNSPVGIGILGCGNISGIYLKNLPQFPWIKILQIADLNQELAQKNAEEHSIPKFGTLEDLLANPEISIVLHLTPPQGHFPLSLKCLDAHKSVYMEKPLSLSVSEGDQLLKKALQKNLRIGCAPDTFLGAGLQTCRKLMDDGWIGTP